MKQKYIENLKWLAAGGGAAVPALSFFTDSVPPNSGYLSFILSALAGAIIIVTYNLDLKDASSSAFLNRNMKRGIKFIAFSLVLMITYFMFLDYTTVVNPQTLEDRYQIGFGLSDFGLTEEGVRLKKKYPDWTATKLLLTKGGFNDKDVPKLIWKNWTIAISSVLLYLLFIGMFLNWVLGFSFLAKLQKEGKSAS